MLHICDRCSANYGIFCHLINLTKFNHQANIAYISAHAAPDLYSSLVLYVDYIRATFTLVLLDELILVSSISLLMWGEPIGNHARIYNLGYSYEPQYNLNDVFIKPDYDRF